MMKESEKVIHIKSHIHLYDDSHKFEDTEFKILEPMTIKQMKNLENIIERMEDELNQNHDNVFIVSGLYIDATGRVIEIFEGMKKHTVTLTDKDYTILDSDDLEALHQLQARIQYNVTQ